MSPDGESGVSAIVGAVLLVALFSTAFTIYTVTALPEWKAEREEAQQARVAGELSGLRADIEALAARREAGPVLATLPLETPRVPVLQQTPARAGLGIEDGFDVAFDFPATPSLFLSGGAAVASPTTALATPPCAGKCVVTVQDLVLGIATSGVNANSDVVAITLTVTDSAASPATVTATLAHVGSSSGCAGELRLTVVDVSTRVHYVEPCAGDELAAAGTPYRVSLLDDDYTFRSSLARLEAPLQFAFSSSTNGATLEASGYTMVYEDASGLLRATGTGIAAANPVADAAGSRLVYSPGYFAYPSQDLVFEGGAVLVDAGTTRQAVTADPSFRMEVANGVGSLEWTILVLSGDGAVSGGREATVAVTYEAIQDVVLLTPSSCDPCASIALTTDTAPGWGSFLSLQSGAANAGASAAATTMSGTTTLELSSGTGPVTGGWVLHLRIIQADVALN